MNTRISFLLIVLLFTSTSQICAQLDKTRAALDPTLAPFYHGVASGGALPEQVIIWTRLTYDTTGSVAVNWNMATDTGMTDIIASGFANTDETVDWTVKVDVEGLEPNEWYYYQFDFEGRQSMVGRTRTAPVGDIDSLRFGVVSCAHYEFGYFNAYDAMPNRNDLNAVVHLGDYIYEYEVGGTIPGREFEPPNEIINLEDYRTRYSHYHLDADLRYVHQQYPMLVIWDDHETANNSFKDGAENHTPGAEGDWEDRKNAGMQAWNEWLPVRLPDTAATDRIYRKIRYGDLVDILMMDTRLIGRDEQVSTFDPALTDTTRTLLGADQREWMFEMLSDTTTQWKVLAQQVMMAPMELFGIPINSDQWDGYPAERQRLYDYVMDSSIQDLVVITGDIHSSWANDLPLSGYDPATGANSAAVEFVTTSITTSAIPLPVVETVLMGSNPHIKYIDMEFHGFMVLDINKTRTQADWIYVSTISDTVYDTIQGPSWMVNHTERHLNAAPGPLEPPVNTQDLAPIGPPNPPLVGLEPDIVNDADLVLVGVYPNPFFDKLQIQYHLYRPHEVTFKIVDVNGKEILSESIGKVDSGLHYAELRNLDLQPGNYFLLMQTENQIWKRNLLRLR